MVGDYSNKFYKFVRELLTMRRPIKCNTKVGKGSRRERRFSLIDDTKVGRIVDSKEDRVVNSMENEIINSKENEAINTKEDRVIFSEYGEVNS